MTEHELSTARPSAVMWDMDGTIIDSEPYWVAAEIELVERFGGTWTHEDGLKLVGQGLPHAASYLQRAGAELTADEIISQLTDRVIESLNHTVPWRPGAVQMMEAIAAAGIPQALVTMSIERMATLVADLVPGTPFTVVVSGDHVSNGKPDPEAYLLAATQLGVDITDCVAFEDSVAGITSAARSGAVTIGLPHLIDVSAAPANELWTSLAEKSVDDLFTTFQRAKGIHS